VTSRFRGFECYGDFSSTIHYALGSEALASLTQLCLRRFAQEIAPRTNGLGPLGIGRTVVNKTEVPTGDLVKNGGERIDNLFGASDAVPRMPEAICS
jgi:hypothetical protein